MNTVLYYSLLVKLCVCYNIDTLFGNINKEFTKLNGIAADITWESSVNPNVELATKTQQYQLQRILWQNDVCNKFNILHTSKVLNSTQDRQAYLLCRGPRYTYDEAKEITDLYKELQTIYSDISICIPSHSKRGNNLTAIEDAILETYVNNRIDAPEFSVDVICLNGQEDFETVMQMSKKQEILKWVWLKWRENLMEMKRPFERLIYVENKASVRNGYPDIGEAWQDELEIPDLQELSRQLYEEFEPLYVLLHGVVRFYLRKEYGEIVPERGPIPAHLLGDLWAQKWDHLIDRISPNAIDLDDRIKKLNWSVDYMVNRVEDFYLSLGLPGMTDGFWRNSFFTKENEVMTCHGAAADMFKYGDFRIMYCSGTAFEDFRVLHHEMGHIQYFMAYQNQPGLFRQANAALHESIGDAIMNGVMAPQHLYRLRLVNDSELYGADSEVMLHENVIQDTVFKNAETDNFKIIDNDKIENDFTVKDILMLKQALNKLPQIPYSLAIEKIRLKYFKGALDERYVNKEFWTLIQDIQGVAPLVERNEKYFDVGAEYHVPNNTPFSRYFLSHFLQHQIFESLCKGTVFGRRDAKEDVPDTIIPSQCDIYGSKTAGKILKDLMSRGHSQHWREILQASIGENTISSSALLHYYQPLKNLLTRLIQKYNIPIGW